MAPASLWVPSSQDSAQHEASITKTQPWDVRLSTPREMSPSGNAVGASGAGRAEQIESRKETSRKHIRVLLSATQTGSSQQRHATDNYCQARMRHCEYTIYSGNIQWTMCQMNTPLSNAVSIFASVSALADDTSSR